MFIPVLRHNAQPVPVHVHVSFPSSAYHVPKPLDVAELVLVFQQAQIRVNRADKLIQLAKLALAGV